jgi:hypothetical protein
VCSGIADVFTVNADFKSKFTKIKVKTVTAMKETTEEAQKTRSKVDDDRKPLVRHRHCHRRCWRCNRRRRRCCQLLQL